MRPLPTQRIYMEYYYIKALHLIFVITWFAGLFYIVRLFVYQIEASQKPSPDKEILGEQFKIMAKRLWLIITWPSMILAVLFAIWLMVLRPFYFSESCLPEIFFFSMVWFDKQTTICIQPYITSYLHGLHQYSC